MTSQILNIDSLQSFLKVANSQFSFPSKAKDVRIVAVGIGQYEDFQGQLEEIAGENVHNASNFDKLSDLFSDILAETCSK